MRGFSSSGLLAGDWRKIKHMPSMRIRRFSLIRREQQSHRAGPCSVANEQPIRWPSLSLFDRSAKAAGLASACRYCDGGLPRPAAGFDIELTPSAFAPEYG